MLLPITKARNGRLSAQHRSQGSEVVEDAPRDVHQGRRFQGQAWRPRGFFDGKRQKPSFLMGESAAYVGIFHQNVG